MSVQPPTRRPVSRTRRRLMTGLGALLCIGLLALILTPVIFRGLGEEWQFRLIRRFPFMSSWQVRATVPFNSLPTIDATSGDAAALLLTPLTSPTLAGSPTAVLILPSDTATATITATHTATLTTSPTATNTAVPPTPTATDTATLTNTAKATEEPPLAGTTLASSVTPVPPTATDTATNTATMTDIPTSTPTDLPSETPIPTFTSTVPPTITHAPTWTLTPPPTATPFYVPLSVHLDGYKWIPQTWNNCGPANVTQALQPYGWNGDQAEAATYLKPNQQDKNVSPSEIVTYVNEKIGKKLGTRAITRAAGDLELIRQLVSLKFSVILETGFSLPDEGWMGHYITIIGYDEKKAVLYGLDTYLGDGPGSLGVTEKYDDLDTRWQQFNRVYIVLYPTEREAELAAVLGANMDAQQNAKHALDVARAEASAEPNNQYAWFNMGSSYVMLEQYKEATIAFDQSLRVGGGLPFRMLWYQFGPFEAYYRIGNFATTLSLVNTTMQTTPYVEETFYWRGMAQAAQGKITQATEDFKHAVKFNPNFAPASEALAQLQNGTFKPPLTP
jgi:tetratricopeptide (TPR) repeat protein